MDLSRYLETMKNLPERFSNLTFWRGVRKLRDKMVETFEYVGEWGNGIESGLSSLRGDLANKLPKNPDEWEPWTDEEQETARERIGITGDYKLLRDITVEEDTSILNLGDVQSKDAIIILKSDSGCGATPFYRASSGLLFFAGSGAVVYSVSRISRYYVETIARSTAHAYTPCNALLADVVDADLGNLTLDSNSSTNLIPAGTNIKIYVK